MNNQVLQYLGKSHADYIHARGKISTDKFVQTLEPQDNEKILEIGFGTGATLIQLASITKAELFGYELSPLMYRKALGRVKFCNMSERINIELLDKINHFPASDNAFDRVYVESVLAIQEGNDLKELLIEIKRVLKPNGIFQFNETLWLDSTTKTKAAQINQICKHSFGIIQSNDEYLHIIDWKNLLLEVGFQIDTLTRVDEIPYTKNRVSRSDLRSQLYTKIGKLKVLASASMRKNRKDLGRSMKSINHNENLLEGIILKAYNKI